MITKYSWEQAEAQHANLTAAIDRLRRRYPESKLKPGGSWASPKVLQHDHRVTPLLEWLGRVDTRMSGIKLSDVAMWAQLMKKGDVVRPHRHRVAGIGLRNRYAGVYFVTIPQFSGQIYFPRADDVYFDGVGTIDHAQWSVHCNAGEAVVFDADEIHGVTRHQVDAERITIAWSVL